MISVILIFITIFLGSCHNFTVSLSMSTSSLHHIDNLNKRRNIIAKNIIKSFHARCFQPYDSFFNIIANNHYQTIIGSEALKVKIFGQIPRSFNTTTERFFTQDNDFFDVDYANMEALTSDDKRSKCKGLVILCHGLESNIKGSSHV